LTIASFTAFYGINSWRREHFGKKRIDTAHETRGSECAKVLNTSHRNKASLSAGDVYAVAEDLYLVRKLAEKSPRSDMRTEHPI
jgi:hypothetical protein